jgi:hypothetical protein
VKAEECPGGCKKILAPDEQTFKLVNGQKILQCCEECIERIKKKIRPRRDRRFRKL